MNGAVALVFLVVFTWMYQQTRDGFLRSWQVAWVAYVLHFALRGASYFLGHPAALAFAADIALAGSAICIFASTRIVRREPTKTSTNIALLLGAAIWSAVALWAHTSNFSFPIGDYRAHVPQVRYGIAALALVAAVRMWQYALRRHSAALTLLAVALAFWAPLLPMSSLPPAAPPITIWTDVWVVAAQVLLGVAVLLVGFEKERRTVEENLLGFSTLEVQRGKLLGAEEIRPNVLRLLNRVLGVMKCSSGALLIAEEWRSALPTVSSGLPQRLIDDLSAGALSEFLIQTAKARGGVISVRDLEDTVDASSVPSACFDYVRKVLAAQGIYGFTAAAVQSGEHNFGVLLFRHETGQRLPPSRIRLLSGLAAQIGLTLENYVLMRDALRRTREYELLTLIGQVISSRLDADEVLRAVQQELGKLFDTNNFYAAFTYEGGVRFELDVQDGEFLPKSTRKGINAITEYVIRTGEPLLVRSDMERVRARLGLMTPSAPAKCICAVPIIMCGRPMGMMAALNREREFVYTERDLEVMKTAAGQVAVAMENARLFAEEQRRVRYLNFLNTVSQIAISSEDAQQMLGRIGAEIQKSFHFDHIGVGILDYATKEIEIRVEAGCSANQLGRRIPLGSGTVGRVARSSEVALLNAAEAQPGSLLIDAHSVLAIPIIHGESLLGVLNVESRTANAFGEPEVLILRTLADLLAAALHNAFIFQKLQQQAITDGLTGIKTRRFFLEALQSEWKRASRSGRPFSVVMVDLDQFKVINDGMGHLEGDLVLARVGRLLEQKCRQSNVVARYGGDEFVILMPETGLEQSQVLSERLRQWLESDPMLRDRKITGSFGVATFPLHGATAEEIIRVADAGMYCSKHGGGNRVSTVELPTGAEAGYRQGVTAFIEGFLQREHTGPELCEELVRMLKKLASSMDSSEAAEKALREAVLALSRASETRELHAIGHGDAVAHIAEQIARAVEVSPAELKEVVFAARIHDVGKLLIPERVLNKTEPLTDDEFYLMKMHATLGAEIVGAIPGASRLQKMVRHHHERYDGRGYPDELRAEVVPLGARILGIAEAFANMTMDRPYASARDTAEALMELERVSGSQFDPALVRVLTAQTALGRATTAGV